MSQNHKGNTKPEIDQEEHYTISGVNAKGAFIFDNAGNQITSFGGSPNTGNVTLNPSPNFIGLVTIANTPNVSVLGNLTLSDPKGFIGLVTVVGSLSAAAGNVTLDAGSKTGIIGNVTLSDAKTFIGLVTNVPAYGSAVTVVTQIVSATGNTTIFVSPASNRFFMKNLHVSSLGRAEVEIRSGATTLIPFTSLSTTGGFVAHYGEMGLPQRAQADGFVVNLNGGTTISIMASGYFQA